MHIVNYENNGFVIVSGDNRFEPVLAFSDVGSFPTDTKTMPEGLLGWLYDYHNEINNIRNRNIIQNNKLKKSWNKFIQLPKNKLDSLSKPSSVYAKSRVPLYTDYSTEGNCFDGSNSRRAILYYNVGPLLSTQWSQGVGFNELVPSGGCNATSNGHYWTGCVATALGQVMKYHEYPSSYNWALMQNNYGGIETAMLMRDLGYSFNLDVNYGCDGSSANSERIPQTLLNYGYQNANYSCYDYGVLKREIAFGKPVILRGDQYYSFLFFGGKNGHCWVADGVSEQYIYDCVEDPNTYGEMMDKLISIDTFLHMNWGWGGVYNGWYYSGNFNPGSMSYNKNVYMITNIINP